MTTAILLPGYVGLSSAMAYSGMVCILAAFILETRGRLDSRGGVYLWMMIAGSALLAIRAAHMGEWAFLILETVWCIAAIAALLRPRPYASPSPGATG
ncbi:MAG: hypothetical protein IH848_07780 [Acidobacteria bacterium]|nr:hypothetical protein [Acidobacteriota bacterium]